MGRINNTRHFSYLYPFWDNCHIQESIPFREECNAKFRVMLNSGIWDLGSGIGFFRIPDLTSQNHSFVSLMTKFWLLKFHSVLAEKIFFTCWKIKLFTILWYLWLQKMVWQQKTFPPLLLEPGSLMDENHDPEPVFLNVYGAQESIPRNEFRQPM